jgi:hypothetical protein
VPAERLVGTEGQFEGRAPHVVHEDMQVVGVDERPLRRSIEEIGRIPDEP